MICLFINMLRVNPVLAVKCYIFKNGGGWNLFRCKLEFVISRLIVLVFYCTIYRHIYFHQVWFFFLEKLIVIHSYRPRCLAIDWTFSHLRLNHGVLEISMMKSDSIPFLKRMTWLFLLFYVLNSGSVHDLRWPVLYRSLSRSDLDMSPELGRWCTCRCVSIRNETFITHRCTVLQ